MDYQSTIDYLMTRLPMFSRIGSDAFKKDLTNTIALCEFLGDPHKKFKSIHVGGTNGKGSVSHMLAAILQQCGYKTGLYTSPHLKDFRERIKINGEMIGEKEVIDFTERISGKIEELNPSFFEITVAMAFEHFAKNKVDVAIIEVGLGGRLDSTNVIAPEMSVITNISYDHQAMLGNTLGEIALEKAGIIKENIPVVVGEVNDETRPVFEKIASDRKAPISIASEYHNVAESWWNKNEFIIQVASQHHTDRHEYHLDLPGIYQAENVITVLETVRQLNERGWNIQQNDLKNALSHVKKLTGLHGRWEKIHDNPTVVLDVAHNEDGMRFLVQQIEITDHNNLHIVMGVVKDKDVDVILKLLPDRAFYYFTQANIPRALDAHTLKSKAEAFGLKGNVYTDVNNALHSAIKSARPDDLIVVCGSVFVVGEVSL